MLRIDFSDGSLQRNWSEQAGSLPEALMKIDAFLSGDPLREAALRDEDDHREAVIFVRRSMTERWEASPASWYNRPV